jgi:hypothetical protein
MRFSADLPPLSPSLLGHILRMFNMRLLTVRCDLSHTVPWNMSVPVGKNVLEESPTMEILSARKSYDGNLVGHRVNFVYDRCISFA